MTVWYLITLGLGERKRLKVLQAIRCRLINHVVSVQKQSRRESSPRTQQHGRFSSSCLDNLPPKILCGPKRLRMWCFNQHGCKYAIVSQEANFQWLGGTAATKEINNARASARERRSQNAAHIRDRSCLLLTLWPSAPPPPPACHPSCLACSGPSQADCTTCPPLASLQDGYCRTTCQDGRFLHATTGECLSKSARTWADAVTHVCVSLELHQTYMRWYFKLERPQKEQNPRLSQRSMPCSACCH